MHVYYTAMNTPRHIMIFSTAYFPYVGGAEVAIRELTKRMSDYEFDLITARFDKELPQQEMIDNVRVHRIGWGSKFDKVLLPFLGTLYVLKHIKKYPIDIFWGVMATYATGIPYIVNILRGKTKRIPVVLTLQEGDSEEYIEKKGFGIAELVWKICMLPVLITTPRESGGMIATSWQLALPRTDIVTTISTYLKDRAREYGYKGSIYVVPNGVDVARFSRKPNPDTLAALTKRFGKKGKDRYIITTSRLEEKNAVGDIIRALKHLPDYVKLIIAGEGSDGEMLYNLSKQLRVDKRVVFLGTVGQEDIPLYLHMSDVFVRPSLSEGFGISFIEAMAAGLPVVATPVGGITDFLFDVDTPGMGTTRHMGKILPTGLFCEPHKPTSIARQVTRFLEDTKLRNTVIKNAYDMVKEKYNWWKLADMMRAEVFEKLLKG